MVLEKRANISGNKLVIQEVLKKQKKLQSTKQHKNIRGKTRAPKTNKSNNQDRYKGQSIEIVPSSKKRS